MARGTVKDPTGHQSKSYDFGYIQRTEAFSQDPETMEVHSTLWADDLKPKVIPFLNKPEKAGDDSTRPHAQGQTFDFKVVEAEVHYEGKCLGTIGIAIRQ